MSALLNHPMIAKEQWENFTETDHRTWKTLFESFVQLFEALHNLSWLNEDPL